MLQEQFDKNPNLESQLKKMALPQPISILVPTYNRRNFLPLFTYNIMIQKYPHNLLEIVIDDDGDISFMNDKDMFNFEKTTNVKVRYFKSIKKRPIGVKRNNLVKLAKHKIVCFMDDDDIYTPDYISYSYNVLSSIPGNQGLVGCTKMNFVFPYEDWQLRYIQCEFKNQIHEATMMFTKKYFKSMGGFCKTSKAEGYGMIQTRDKHIKVTDCDNCMCCVVHQNNTIDKSKFINKRKINAKFECDQKHILKQVLQIK